MCSICGYQNTDTKFSGKRMGMPCLWCKANRDINAARISWKRDYDQ
ncbi:MAG: hypothetical protein ACLUV8_12320 [Clostridium sp.]